MTKFLISILILGFAIQCSGAAVYIKKTVTKTEQCPDGSQSGEENSKQEFKKDKDQIVIHFNIEFYKAQVAYVMTENIQYYSSGFYSNPYLPPR